MRRIVLGIFNFILVQFKVDNRLQLEEAFESFAKLRLLCV